MFTTAQTLSCLPDPPTWGYYSVEQVSPLVQRVWLHDTRDYTYTTEEVKSVWGFVKGEKVHPPKNSQHMKPKSVSHVTEAFRLSCYTTIVPDLTQLPLSD